ncbi:MAG: FAD:protein FMN transferase [Deltaproteobacteria bacterium]|nr:FAD:protein FMN transferase [Deltaproteobacteria bacterium]
MSKQRITYISVVFIVFSLLAVSLYVNREKESVTFSRMQMGTIVQITAIEGNRANFENAANKAFDEIDRLEAIFSSYKPDSDVSRISQSAGAEPVKVSPEVIEVLKAALKISELSGGAFDPTVGSLGRVWGFSGEKGFVPTREEVAKILPLVNYKNIILDEANSKAGLSKKGMVLNLGGVAKGYIVKNAIEVLKNNGVERGIVHAGGDMSVFQKDEKKPFVIGIQDPRKKGKLLGEAYVYNGAATTSGDYERYFIKDNIRYHHILDPATGFPANRSRSATIVAEDPTLADALSTAVFVMGVEKGMPLIESLDNVEGVIVDSEGRIYKSSGFKGKITPQSPPQ